MQRVYKYLSVFISCLVITFLSTVYINSVANKLIMLAVVSDFIVPFLNDYFYKEFIEEDSNQRWKLTLSKALGYAIGTYITLKMI